MDGMDTTAGIWGGDMERREGSGMKAESMAELTKKDHYYHSHPVCIKSTDMCLGKICTDICMCIGRV